MKRFALATIAALLLSFSSAPRAAAELPQYVIDRLEEIPVDRATAAQRTQAAGAALATWRAAAAAVAPDTEQARLSDIAARAAFAAGNGVDAALAAQATLANTGAEPMQRANALLILAIQTFDADPSTEAQLVGTLEQATHRADGVLRARAARALALAHMRRDDQPAAQNWWRQMEIAAGDIPSNATYDFEVALIGRAASHGYAGQGQDGVTATQAVITRMGEEMALLQPAREASAGEIVYAHALAWSIAFRVENRVRHYGPGVEWYQVGSSAQDANGQFPCVGEFRLRPNPRFPANAAIGGWQGSTVLRLSTDAEGRVIHAEAIAAVPPIRTFSAATLQTSDTWRFIADEDAGPSPCRLNREGFLMPWLFFGG